MSNIGSIVQLTDHTPYSDHATCAECGALTPMHATWCKNLGEATNYKSIFDVIAERDLLRAENAALRKALQRVSIEYDAGIERMICWCCHKDWLVGAAVTHAAGCLAAPKETT